jgi:NADPH-dependent glutamate synthase beta subunit-like oxidoreductase
VISTIRCRLPPAASASIPATTAAAARPFDEAVNMREVHRFIADSICCSPTASTPDGGARRRARKLAPTGRKVAVAGAGPTGLTAAFYLALLGHDVTVSRERPSRRHAALRLPEYRLPKPCCAASSS